MYATDDNEQRFLRYIRCDRCDAKLTPGPHVMTSGWVKRGSDYGLGSDKVEIDLCPEHA